MSAQPIGNSRQLADMVTWLGQRLQRKANRTARYQARIAKLTKQLATERARLIELNARDDKLNLRDGAKIWVYSGRHLELRHRQQVELGSGTAYYRDVREGAMEFTIDKDTTIAEILERFPEAFSEVVAIKYSLRKNVLKRDYPWLLDLLSTASAPAQNTFTISPRATEEILRASVQRFHQTAIELGLVPNTDAAQPADSLSATHKIRYNFRVTLRAISSVG